MKSASRPTYRREMTRVTLSALRVVPSSALVSLCRVQLDHIYLIRQFFMYTATPDLRYVPKKYHEFMIPSVRKLYLEIPSQAKLKTQIALLETRVQSLDRDKKLLMTKCESHISASAVYAEEERNARLAAEKAKSEVEDLKRKYDALKGKYHDMKSK